MKCDVLVIGGGILGFSSAYHLKRMNPSKKIVLIDKLGSPGQGNSAKSEGAFRNLFTSETNYLLADTTIEFFKHCQEELGYDLKLEFIGYLWLFDEEQYNRIKPAVETMKKRGIEVETYKREKIEKMIPTLNTDFSETEDAELLGIKNVDYGVYGRKCGSLDADALVRAYEAEFLKLGGEVMYNTEATKIIIKPVEELSIPGEPFVWQEIHVVGAKTNKGEIIAETTVVAAGVWSHTLLDPIGLDSFQRPKKRQIFAFKDPKLDSVLKTEGINPEGELPLVILPTSGIYLKSEITEGSLWLGCADNLGRRFELEEDPQPEEDYYTNNIYHILVKYFPCFKDVRPMNMWAGQYAINSLDETPVIYKEKGLIYAGACSGSGIMKCDALGRVAATLYAGEEEAELYGGRCFRGADLSVADRNIERETFII